MSSSAGQQQRATSSSSSLGGGASSSKIPSSTPISESMLRRMAGQSVNKAGLSIDQSEVNKIIAEASKGSKFYENERVKDEQLGRRIKATLARRDALLATADIPRLEAECDKIIERLEASRDLSRTVVHIDLDAFFASVEELADPSLKGTAFGVGGGVLTTASYEARKFGVRSGMAGFVAKKLCPHLKFVKSSFGEYDKWSKKVFDVARRYDPTLQKAGCDEGYLDITNYMQEHQMSAEDAVQHFRAECVAETGLTVSAGIAPNKMLAKICSDINKPNGQYALEFSADAVRSFCLALKIRKVPGIGKVSERVLESLGVITCGDVIANRGVLLLIDFGVTDLLRSALGCCSNKVEPGKREDRKSVGVESTFRDKEKKEDLVKKVEELAESLEEDLTRLRFVGRTLTLKYKTHDYKPFTRARTISGEFSTKEQILTVGLQLLEKELPLKVRLLGLRMTNLRDLNVEKKGGLDGFVTRSPPKKKTSKVKVKSRATSEEGSEPIAMASDDGGMQSDEDGMNQFADDALLDDVPEVEEEAEGSGGGSADAQTCPVCSHTFKPTSTNDEINSHVDFCLSRGTITSLTSNSSRKPISASSTAAGKKRMQDEAVVISDDDDDPPPKTTKKTKKAVEEKKLSKKQAKPKSKPQSKPLNAFEKMMKAR